MAKIKCDLCKGTGWVEIYLASTCTDYEGNIGLTNERSYSGCDLCPLCDGKGFLKLKRKKKHEVK